MVTKGAAGGLVRKWNLGPQRPELGLGRHEGKSAGPGPRQVLGHQGTRFANTSPDPPPKGHDDLLLWALWSPLFISKGNAPAPTMASLFEGLGP